jgi:tetratricopeptide (TPR) repeat protein
MQNELFEKIELYLNNGLNEEEVKLFEEQLKNDAKLREALALYKTIDDEMRQKIAGTEGEEKLKQTLSGLNKKYFEQGSNTAKVIPLPANRRWLFAAAAVLLLVVAGLYWYFFSGNKNNETLYARYAVHQPLSLQRGNEPISKILQDAIVAYNAKKFDEALTGLASYLQSDSSDAELLLAKNICLTETGKYEQAIEGLNKLVDKNEIFKSQALWYKALAYLKQNNKVDCKKTLESIPAGADKYTQAKELLKEL